jgi:hypothetical protein
VSPRQRLTPYVLLGVLVLGTGLGIGLGLSETPTAKAAVAAVGWKPVTYQGVVVDVPGDWAVEPWYPQCGVTAPTVFTGPENAVVLYCPLYSPGGAEVILGALPPGQVGKSTTVILSGMKVRVISGTEKISHGSPRPTVAEVYVHLLAKHLWIWIFVAESAKLPGGSPGRAEQIEGTIRPVNGST